jgi:hypothetical protein
MPDYSVQQAEQYLNDVPRVYTVTLDPEANAVKFNGLSLGEIRKPNWYLHPYQMACKPRLFPSEAEIGEEEANLHNILKNKEQFKHTQIGEQIIQRIQAQKEKQAQNQR